MIGFGSVAMLFVPERLQRLQEACSHCHCALAGLISRPEFFDSVSEMRFEDWQSGLGSP